MPAATLNSLLPVLNRCLLLVVFLPAAAAAETVMTAEEFEELSTGRTLYFEQSGLPFGAEQYLPGRKTLWKPEGGKCQSGIWYQSGALICFLYEDGGPACWKVTHDSGQLSASMSLADDKFDLPIDLSGIDDKPLDCPGPDLGV